MLTHHQGNSATGKETKEYIMGQKDTVHGYVESMLKRTSKPYAEIAQSARKTFGSETSPASVRHYASKMRRGGVKLKDRPTVRETAYA